MSYIYIDKYQISKEKIKKNFNIFNDINNNNDDNKKKETKTKSNVLQPYCPSATLILAFFFKKRFFH